LSATTDGAASGGNRVTRAELPSGTVTFLFTDIEGSTRLLAHLGHRYSSVLSDHQQLLRYAFSGARGREIDTQGDAFLAVFPRAKDAVAALQVDLNEKAESPVSGAFAEPSDGLEPSTPSLPWNIAGNRWQRICLGFWVYEAGRFAPACRLLQPRGSIKAPSPGPKGFLVCRRRPRTGLAFYT
jgi:Adenylate and Guanylate cyclase catalytic domain